MRSHTHGVMCVSSFLGSINTVAGFLVISVVLSVITVSFSPSTRRAAAPREGRTLQLKKQPADGAAAPEAQKASQAVRKPRNEPGGALSISRKRKGKNTLKSWSKGLEIMLEFLRNKCFAGKALMLRCLLNRPPTPPPPVLVGAPG